jgi:hypothetical protein
MDTVKSMVNGRALSAALLAVMLFGASLSAIAAPTDPVDEGLFSVVAAADKSSVADDPTAVRSRLVAVDFDRMGVALRQAQGAADTLTLNFFADAVYTAVLDRVEHNPSGGVSWVGHLEGVPLSQVVLVVRDGVMMGDVVAPGLFYQVRYVSDGVHAVCEMDQAALPLEAEPVSVAPPAGDPAQPVSLADDGSTIDVLVVYTDDVLAYYSNNTAAVEAMIDLAVSETNAGYANSGVTQRVNLVHTEMVSYDESGFDWGTTLTRFQYHGDGYFDTVTQPTTGLRDTYCADESVLIVMNTGYCGIGYLMNSVGSWFADYAFAVVSRGCATGNYSFAHEMGHNMGARHDRYVDTANTPWSYSHGYVNVPDRWRTIMAYNEECDCSDEISPCPPSEYRVTPGSPSCTRLLYWSNPEKTYEGDPMGVPNLSDNQQTLDNTALTVANFRTSCTEPVTPTLSAPPDGGGMCSAAPAFDWSSVSRATSYRIQVDDDAVFGSPAISTTTTASYYAHGSPLPLDTYYWRVLASNAAGDSSWSDVWDVTLVTCDERVHLPLVMSD